MRFLFISLFIVFTSSALSSEIEQHECPSYDQIKNFPPIRDQDSHGICWAFAGAGLIEEKMCQEDGQNCGKHFSVIDGHRCWWGEETGLGTKGEGAPGMYPYLDCTLKHGVCLEQYAPFMEPKHGFFSTTDQKDYTDKVLKAFNRVQKIRHQMIMATVGDTTDCNGNCNNNHNEDFIKQIEKIAKKLKKSLNKRKINVSRDLNYFTVLYDSQVAYEALQKIFVPQECIDHRVKLKKISGVERVNFYKNENVKIKLSNIVAGFENHSSSALSVCSRRIMAGSYKDLNFIEKMSTSEEEFNKSIKEQECGAHGIITNGMRWHNGRCQLHIRNSWGKNSALSGWEDANLVLQHTNKVEYLK